MSSKGVNKVILIGNITADPEAKNLPNGDEISNFSVATSTFWKDKDTGESKERPEFHRICAFKRLAEICNQYLKKGSKVYIEGSLRTRSWEKDGQKFYRTEIIANEMQMLDAKNNTITESTHNTITESKDTPEQFDDDIPF